jgi:ribosome-associated protein
VDDGELRTPGGLVVPAHALTWTFARSGGPGGQHVNTTSSKATLTISVDDVTGPAAAVERLRAALGAELRVTSQSNRSQWRNREDCLDRAAALLDIAARPPARQRKPTKPKRGAIERRLESKHRISQKKQGRRGTDW